MKGCKQPRASTLFSVMTQEGRRGGGGEEEGRRRGGGGEEEGRRRGGGEEYLCLEAAVELAHEWMQTAQS